VAELLQQSVNSFTKLCRSMTRKSLIVRSRYCRQLLTPVDYIQFIGDTPRTFQNVGEMWDDFETTGGDETDARTFLAPPDVLECQFDYRLFGSHAAVDNVCFKLNYKP
jgi:hypothetical protein